MYRNEFIKELENRGFKKDLSNNNLYYKNIKNKYSYDIKVFMHGLYNRIRFVIDTTMPNDIPNLDLIQIMSTIHGFEGALVVIDMIEDYKG